MRPRPRSTPQGEHRAVLLDAILAALDPKPGEVAVDCTLGWAGHSLELLKRVGATGVLIGMDLDAENLPKARERLAEVGLPFHLHHGNFAGLAQALGEHGLTQADMILADLGMSSMQVDDPARGFSYRRPGALDMRMDRSRGKTAAQVLATIGEAELARALRELGDEPDARRIAAAIVAARGQPALETTTGLAQLIQVATGQEKWRLHATPGQWTLHPATRTFQALRILVNRELSNLEHLLRVLPSCLKPGGRAAIISFHSGEDRLVKNAFRDAVRDGTYARVSPDPVRATMAERISNPRSRSAKLRWAVRAAYNDGSQLQHQSGRADHDAPH
jgi:16S rRNA (cytosine1402-N4)-methyltransferase